MNIRSDRNSIALSTQRIALFAIYCLISVTASAQTTLVFAPSIGRDIKLGMPYAEVKRQYPDGKDMGTSPALRLLFVHSFRSDPWEGAVFEFQNDRLSSITILENTPNNVEAALYHAARPDRFSSVGYTPADVEAALRKILTAAVKEYGKPDELRLFRGDTDRLVPLFVWNRADANVYLGSPNLSPLPGSGHGVNGIRITLASKQKPIEELVALPSTQEIERELIEHLLPLDLMNLVRRDVPGAEKP